MAHDSLIIICPDVSYYHSWAGATLGLLQAHVLVDIADSTATTLKFYRNVMTLTIVHADKQATTRFAMSTRCVAVCHAAVIAAWPTQ
jgi:hypothetical protein